ncbi:hypothetical protein TSUD_118370 [Trifolium subterraneum]|uniref:BRCT domain-containing protein n=1 Tax=Trifolium subterraneum TaxID=3900 RepID=A0A2Z6MWZ8_TRISU|nr:hypothetical protein TSUD_118370 [Trifolium subterraneum]
MNKDLAPSPEKGINVKDFNVLSREEGGYRSCHLFLSGGDSSSLSVAPSPGNVNVDSLFCPTQDLYQSHHAAAPSKALSLQPAQTSVDLRENMHSVMGDHACEDDVMATYIPETTKRDSLKSPINTIGSVRQQKEKPKVECFKSDDISDAVELSIAASEALVIHDLVKTESVSETLSSAVLEVALRVKQARLEGSEDGSLSSSVESDCSDSLYDLNDFLMEDAYEDIGLSVGVSFEENVCNSATFHAKGVSGDESYNGGINKHNERELTSQLTKFDDNSEQKKLEVNVEMEVQQNPDSLPHSLCGERVMHSSYPGLGANTPKHFTNGLDMADLTSIKPQNSVNSSPFQTSENFKEDRNENRETYLAPERFRSRWLGGWTCKELDSSLSNQNSAKVIPKFHVKETSFLMESADIVPDENSRVLKHDPKCVRETSFLTESADIVLDESSHVLKHDPKCVRETSFLAESADIVPDENSRVLKHDPKCVRETSFLTESADIVLDESSCVLKHESKCVRETSFLTESADIVPDESSCVLKHNPKRAISSQLSMHCEGSHNKPDEGVLDSQDMVRCSSLSLIDPLCSVVPCSFASEHDNYKTRIDKENDTEYFPPLISDFEVDNCQRISDKNTALDCRDEKIKSTLDGKDTPITATEVIEQMSDKLTRVEHTSLKTYSMILPNQDVNQNCNLTPLSTNQSIGVADASLGTRVSESPSTSKHADENRNEANHQHLEKSDELKASEQTQEKRSPINLNHRTRHRLLAPKIAVNDISIEKHINQYVVPETVVQHQQNNNLSKVQVECNKFPDGHVRVRKQVHFSDKVEELHRKRKLSKLESSHKSGREFLLTGLSSHKGRDLEALIRNSGGVILYDIPSPPNSKGKRSSNLSCLQLPIILCKRKHGGGRAFKTLQWLVRSTDEERTLMGVIVVEEKATISRHLKSCAMERDIPIMTSSWIIKSLYSGNLLPFTEENKSFSLPFVQVLEVPDSVDMSEEI